MPPGEFFKTAGLKLLAWLRFATDRARRARYSFMVLMAVVVGVGGGFAAIAFRYLIGSTTWAFSGGTDVTPSGFAQLPWWWILIMPAVGGVIVGLLTWKLAPEVKGTGVAEVMEAVALRGGVIRKRVAVMKAAVVAVCLGSGGSAGREGPIVHVGAAIGSLVGRLFSVPVRMLRTFVGCGAAAGIAATFNAPIAGALFAGEVILGQFGVVSFSAIVISSVVATVISRAFIGDFPAFLVPEFHMHHTYELLFYAAMGLLAAVVGCLFIWALQKLANLFDRIKLPPALKPAIGGLLVGAIGIMLPQALGVGYGAINDAMRSAMPWFILLALLGAKLLATSVTLGSGGAGGVFAPSLFLGAMLGGLVGTLLAAAMPAEIGTPGSYALVAMGAMVAATTRAPITAIIMVFEMTNNYTIILPLMIACILATLLAGQIVRPSIYHAGLLRRGIDLRAQHDIHVLRKLKVADVHRDPMPTVRENAPLSEILDLVSKAGSLHYVVLDRRGFYAGLIHLKELGKWFFKDQQLRDLVIADELCHKDVPAVLPTDNLDLVLKLMGETDLGTLPVIDHKDKSNIIGAITHDAVIDAYNREVLDHDMAGATAEFVTTAERTGSVDLGEGTALMELEVPLHFQGKRLVELNLRATYGVQVVLVKRRLQREKHAELINQVPGPDFELQSGDVMLLVGKPEGLQKISEA
jgi:CIC family chloride channel protein